MIDAHDGTVEVENPAEVLREEDGVFEVTSPYGHVFQVICRRGARMSVCEISEPKRAGNSPSPALRNHNQSPRDAPLLPTQRIAPDQHGSRDSGLTISSAA
jgi:hypothetical protein